MAKPKKVETPPEVVELLPELPMVREESITIGQFFASLVPFFQRARELELSAVSALETARSFTAPTNAQEDAALQRFIQLRSGAKKLVQEHWKISSAIYQLQRRVAAARDRAADAEDQAAQIAQRLHNQYVQAEARRVEEENRKRREAAELEERRKREAERQEAERQANELEAKSDTLSERERVFVALVVGGLPPFAAAVQAGFKESQYATTLLNRPKIAEAVAAQQAAIEIRKQSEAKAKEPVLVDFVEERANIQRAGVDRTTKTAEITDAAAFIEAVCEGRHGIPRDTLEPVQTVLNSYARSMGELINKWPGVRLKKDTRTV